MKDLQKQGYKQYDLLNLKKESNKLKDLNYLKNQVPAGPFTSSQEVKTYLKKTKETKSKNERLYTEVRYARNTCFSIANPEKLFKLKRDGKNLSSEDYGACLITYFEGTTNISKLTLPDLQNALTSIKATMFGPNSDDKSSDDFFLGEHVIAVWYTNKYIWELGVVHSCNSLNKPYISYLVPANDQKTSWTFPEEALLYPTEKKQVIFRRLNVTYHKSSKIRVTLDEDVVKDANAILNE